MESQKVTVEFDTENAIGFVVLVERMLLARRLVTFAEEDTIDEAEFDTIKCLTQIKLALGADPKKPLE